MGNRQRLHRMRLQKKEKHMIKRYSDPRIEGIWKLEAKFSLWQQVELAVIKARESLGKIVPNTYAAIKAILEKYPIDIAYIEEREKVLHHDLNAFIEERLRFLQPALQAEVHRRMTSYDTEEAAFATMLRQSCSVTFGEIEVLLEAIKLQAIKYRFTPMNARTHGQEAEMQSFGKRCLTWHNELKVAFDSLKGQMVHLQYSKLSGAIGTNSGIEPELEKAALDILGFRPFTGATQIMPRILYAPIAGALSDLAMVIDKIANDIRLGARSGRPLWHEPFGKKQKGSSAMPHKKNTIITEQIEGLARMARKYSEGIRENIKTWEERSIEQSCVERVFWPDLFHVTIRAVKNLDKVINGLVVYPNNMMTEIIESRGCYASNDAKETLLELGLPFGLTREEAYRIVQLASHNVFDPSDAVIKKLRDHHPESLEIADTDLASLREAIIGLDMPKYLLSIENVIESCHLRISSQLDADQKTVDDWNAKLSSIFNPSFPDHWSKWKFIFEPSYILSNEANLFEQTFGV